MGLETGTYIEDLVSSNPLGTDPKSQGDDHIRLVKFCLQNSFPDTTGAWSTTRSITAGAATAPTELAQLGQIRVSGGNISDTGVKLGGSDDWTVSRTANQPVGFYDVVFDTGGANAYAQSCVASATQLFSVNVMVTCVYANTIRIGCSNSGNLVDPISVSFTRWLHL